MHQAYTKSTPHFKYGNQLNSYSPYQDKKIILNVEFWILNVGFCIVWTIVILR